MKITDRLAQGATPRRKADHITFKRVLSQIQAKSSAEVVPQTCFGTVRDLEDTRLRESVRILERLLEFKLNSGWDADHRANDAEGCRLIEQAGDS